MMKRIAYTGSLLLVLLAPSGQAFSADYDYNNNNYTPDRTAVEYGSGWYLRGDIGYSAKVFSNLTYYSDARYDYDHQDVGNGMNISGGFGYYYNNNIRFDLMLETSDGHDWSGRTYGTACGGCYSDDTASFDRRSVMANGYYSIGQYGGFKPYVGAGLGLTHVQWNNYVSTSSLGPVSTYSTESDTMFSYALMAGFDYKLNENWTADIGYKWTGIHGGGTVVSASSGLAGDSNFDRIDLHEFKVGLRFDIN